MVELKYSVDVAIYIIMDHSMVELKYSVDVAIYIIMHLILLIRISLLVYL